MVNITVLWVKPVKPKHNICRGKLKLTRNIMLAPMIFKSFPSEQKVNIKCSTININGTLNDTMTSYVTGDTYFIAVFLVNDNIATVTA